jgi:hypothetical protein
MEKLASKLLSSTTGDRYQAPDWCPPFLIQVDKIIPTYLHVLVISVGLSTPQEHSPRSMLGAWALPKPRSNKEGQGCRAHGFHLFGHQCPPPYGNGRLCCTTTPRSSHISRWQLLYIKEKTTSFFLNRKLKKSDKNWLSKLRSKLACWPPALLHNHSTVQPYHS